jgi:glycosyltransferase involved in cell wall biosynthesis
VKIAVNALSNTNQSGQVVLGGHMAAWLDHPQCEVQLVIVCHTDNRYAFARFESQATYIMPPPYCTGWLQRNHWARTALPGLLQKNGVDVLLNGTGMVLARCDLPQVAYAMNPWALVPGIAQGAKDRVKAALQRRGYRVAVTKGAALAGLSQYIIDAYIQNAGRAPALADVVYPGITQDILSFSAASVERLPLRIVSVSAMAPHKGVETLLEAIAVLKLQYQLFVECRLVGVWPHKWYEQAMRSKVEALGLGEQVYFVGHVPRNELLMELAQAQVFCLMSRCESFGIPAAEAQAMGTPVVTSNCCAMPEVGGNGGLYPEVNDVQGTGAALHALLTDAKLWQYKSVESRQNALRFSWPEQSLKLYSLLKTAKALRHHG